MCLQTLGTNCKGTVLPQQSGAVKKTKIRLWTNRMSTILLHYTLVHLVPYCPIGDHTLEKKLNGQGEYPLKGLHHKVPFELNRRIPVQLDLNREITVQFQKHFMMQPSEGIFSLSITPFFQSAIGQMSSSVTPLWCRSKQGHPRTVHQTLMPKV